MSDTTDKDRERADGLAEYLAEFTSGKGWTEADCILETLQEVRADERATEARAAVSPTAQLREAAKLLREPYDRRCTTTNNSQLNTGKCKDEAVRCYNCRVKTFLVGIGEDAPVSPTEDREAARAWVEPTTADALAVLTNVSFADTVPDHVELVRIGLAHERAAFGEVFREVARRVTDMAIEEIAMKAERRATEHDRQAIVGWNTGHKVLGNESTVKASELRRFAEILRSGEVAKVACDDDCPACRVKVPS